jgi:hypothetical protein
MAIIVGYAATDTSPRPGQRWPRPPWPFVVRLLVVVVVLVLVLVLILLLRSAAVERPISAPSPNSPRSPRFTYRLSVRVFMSCRFAARRFAMTNLRARDLATAMPGGWLLSNQDHFFSVSAPSGEYPSQARTGSRGYFGNRGSVYDRRQSTNVLPFDDVIRCA